MNPLMELLIRALTVVAAAAGVLLVLLVVVTWRAVLPGVLIGVLAVLNGLVCTVALAGFLGLAALRALKIGLERLGAAIPDPRLQLGVSGR
ncbi:hypothetical protein AB0L88_44405 [Saccharopolyspora shandongensis]|uniref:hypothetical protein n=1 Tax=Saccharopolyspora shandongensis TaxID=418495 RepID=UPI0034248F8D